MKKLCIIVAIITIIIVAFAVGERETVSSDYAYKSKIGEVIDKYFN